MPYSMTFVTFEGMTMGIPHQSSYLSTQKMHGEHFNIT